MSAPIVQPSAFNVSKVTVTQPKTLDSGGKMSYLNYGERNLLIQTPTLKSPFGFSCFDKVSPPKCSIDLALSGYQEPSKVKELYDALSALDEHMIDLGVKNSKLWFKNEMKRELVAAFYTPIVKFGKDKDGNQTSYPPNIKLQLKRARDTDGFECRIYDQKSKGVKDAKPITGVPIEELLPKKCEVTALMQCTGVWFAGGKFGVSWKAIQMRLESVPEGISNNAFMDDDVAEPAEFSRPAARLVVEDDDEEEETLTRSASAPGPSHAEEDEDEDEEVAPPPVPKKTVVTKTKVMKTVAKAK